MSLRVMLETLVLVVFVELQISCFFAVFFCEWVVLF